MNLDELKKTWQDYDQKLAATHLISEKILKSMIRERSHSTLAKIRRESMLTIPLLAGVAGFCILAIIHNAFDYQYALQYVPLAGIAVASGLFSFSLTKEYTLAQTDLHHDNLVESLKKVLKLHDRVMSSNRKLGLLMFSASMLWPISTMPHIIETKGPLTAVGSVLLTLSVQFIFILLARKAGFFEDRYGNQLRAHLRELEEVEV